MFAELDTIPEWLAPGWDAQGWLDSLKTGDRSARTVRDVWLSAAHTVCGWAVRKRRLNASPFDGCMVEVPKTIKTRETGRAFTDGEAMTILRVAAAVPLIPLGSRGWQWAACRRWAPWIMAYTGARAGEITQVRASDIEDRPGVGPIIKITPEAGTVKTPKVRVIPFHADIGQQVLALAKLVEAGCGPAAPVFHTFPRLTVRPDTVALP